MTSSSKEVFSRLGTTAVPKRTRLSSGRLTRGSSESGRVVGPIYHRLLRSANCLGGLLNPHRLDIGELPDSMGPKLPTMPRPLHSSERNSRIRRHHAIHEHHPRFHALHQTFALILLVGPGACPQSEPAVVGDSNRITQVLRPEQPP